MDRVLAELLREVALRGERAREHQQARRLFVEPLHDAERALLALTNGARQQRADQLVERALLLVVERHGADARGLSHHDDVVVDVRDDVARQAGVRGRARRGR